MLNLVQLLEYHVGFALYSRLLVDFEIHEQLIVLCWSIVAITTLTDCLNQVLVPEKVMPDNPTDQLDLVENSTRLKLSFLVAF